jgi:hypothetical protein
MADARGPLAQCADFTRGGGPPAPDHDATQSARQIRLGEEQTRLIQWAQTHRKLVDRLLPEFSRGGEHVVFFRKGRRRYLKATLPNRHKGYGIALGSISHGAMPSEYLDRLDLQNRIFNDDIRLEWIVVKDDRPIIVTSQPAIKGTEPRWSYLSF